MAWLLRRLTRGAAGGIAISEAVRRNADIVLPGLAVRWSATRWTQTTSPPATATGLSSTVSPGYSRPGPGWSGWAGGDLRQLEGAGRFLDALARLPAAGPPVRGYIVGGPIYATAGSQFTRDELERRAAANGLAGRVGFVPFQTDPADVYRMLDVAVHASTRPEPFGLTIAEAMGCGKPVVVSAAGGAAELFTPGHDGLGHTPGT